MKKALLLFVLACFSVGLKAQDATTEGKEFWVAFLGNGFEENSSQGAPPYLITQILISSKQDCSGTITNPNSPGWSRDFTVEANNIRFIDIPREQAYVEMNEYREPVNKGLFIQTTEPVTVFCANAARYSFDASFVLPIQALADDYIIQTFDQTVSSGEFTSAFVITATEEGTTTVDITPSTSTKDGRPANEEFSITLQKGQSYQVRSTSSWAQASRDLSGSRVTARDCKKIAVFNGNNLTAVPVDGGDYDCVFEQAMPLQTWGREFVVTASLGRQYNDVVKITSAHDNNTILKNGQPFAVLNSGESRTFALDSNETSCYIEAQHSCAVYLYNHSKDPGTSWSGLDGNGAPSMVLVAPIEQRIENLTFSTFNDLTPGHVSVEKHYVNIIVRSQDASSVAIDGNPIPAEQFENVTGNDNYKFYRTEISHGVHQILCPNGFNAHVYGFGNATGYAYMAGSRAADLNTKIIVDGQNVNPNDTVVKCVNHPIVFDTELNYVPDGIIWNYGDGQSNENTFTHTFSEAGLHEMTLNILTSEDQCQSETTTTTLKFYIITRLGEVQDFEEMVCIGEHYSGHGFDNVLILGDTMLSRQAGGSGAQECPDVVYVHLTCYPLANDTTIVESICFKGPDTYIGHGFSIPYTEQNINSTLTQSQTMPNHNGCDRLVTLQLTISNINETQPVVQEACNQFVWDWNGHTYYESAHFSDTIPDTESGCLTIGHLWLDMEYTPDPAAIRILGNSTAPWVIPATDFQINSYEFTLNDNNPACTWDSVTWQFCQRNPASGLLELSDINWKMIEKGAKHDTCKIYVIEHVNDTVWLRATAYNRCTEQGIAQDRWLVCSFYDIDENERPTAAFQVVPNPNNGQMTLHLERLTGNIEIKVYDMKGTLIDVIHTQNDMGFSTLPYSLKGKSRGVYYFVATAKEGTVARKVVVTP